LTYDYNLPKRRKIEVEQEVGKMDERGWLGCGCGCIGAVLILGLILTLSLCGLIVWGLFSIFENAYALETGARTVVLLAQLI